MQTILRLILLTAMLLTYTGIAICGEVTYLFIGTYTNGKPGKGIYIFRFDVQTGNLKFVSSGSDITNPSFITLNHTGNYLYACTESLTQNAGGISSFAFDSLKGSISFINKQSSDGENPVYVTVDKSDTWLINGNYTQPTISARRINADGSIDITSEVINFIDKSIGKRQKTAHIHATVFSPEGSRLFAPDLGADKIRIFTFEKDNIVPLRIPSKSFVRTTAGGGPRHFTFHPNGKFGYCIEELSGTLSAYNYLQDSLILIQNISSYSKPNKVYSSADIHISPDGLFLYASNRLSENTISIFSIDTITGKLTLKGHQPTNGEHPRNFTIDPTGNFILVANQLSSSIVVFKRDKQTGLLSDIDVQIKVPSPSCLLMRTYNIQD